MSVRSPRARLAILWIPAVLLMVGIRLVDLESDPYRWLDWDTGLMTDEGFYSHNARNVALFGHPRTDEFNNMLASPLLHYLQSAVFTAFGFTTVNARLISVLLSLLTIVIYFAALRRSFGIRVAVTATLFLGLDHTNVLFNRMALLDTPATLLAVCVFYAVVRASDVQSKRRIAWLAGCGVLLGLTFVTRSLCLYLIPAALIAFALPSRDPISIRVRIGRIGPLIGGLMVVLLLYAVMWYLPNKNEIDHMNGYYRMVQLQPDSVGRLAANIRIAFLGDRYGVFPYLFRHTPVLFALALLGLWGAVCLHRPNCPTSPTRQTPTTQRPNDPTTQLFLAAWLLSAWALFAVSNYAPNRYFVSTYPALFGLASIALWRLPGLISTVRLNDRKTAVGMAIVAWFLGYHALESVLHRGGLLSPSATLWVLYTAPTLLSAALFRWPIRIPDRRLSPARYRLMVVVPILIGWTGINAGWLADWWVHREYTLSESSIWLSRNLPPGSVLMGDVAPGLGMDTPFVTANVMKGFANDARPVESFAPRPRYVLTIDGEWKTPYWNERYPDMVDPSRRIRHWRVLRWMIGLYPAERR